MKWNVIPAPLAGKLGELKTPKETGSPEFRRRQAVREYNALLGRTDPTRPAGAACMPCLRSEKITRRNKRHDLIWKAESLAGLERNSAKKKRLLETADRLWKDMDRVEDARLALHTYTATEDPSKQEEFLRDLRDKPPPGFDMASLDQVARDFGVDKGELQDIVDNPEYPTQKIMIYERDEEVLGLGPKYTVGFRGSTLDRRDWNNNGRNEAGFEAPHQQNAARLGKFLKGGANDLGKPIDLLVATTGHSKGASESQAFAAATGCSARVFNPAGYNPQQYIETHKVRQNQIRIDRTSIVERDKKGNLVESTASTPHTDPLYFAQHKGLTQYFMEKPVTTGSPRELAPIDPNLSVPSNEQSDSEAHSMLQVIEALERDKEADQNELESYF